MLSERETKELKQKILRQVEANFPAEQVENAKEQIESMDSEQFESFLEKNKLIKKGEEPAECVFCSIVSEKIKSVKIDKNDKAIVILEINPISKGHALVITKEHTDKPQKQALVLAKKISRKIKSKFKPKKMEISESRLFGHEVINILPVYKNENFSSERKPSKIEDLEIIREELEKKTEKIKKSKVEKIKEIFWLPKRIP